MTCIEDVMADLSETAKRDLAAAAHLRRLADFLSAEDARGFDIEVEVEVVGGGVLRVELTVYAPAGEEVTKAQFEGVVPISDEPVPNAIPRATKSPVAADLAVSVPVSDACKPDAPKAAPARWTEEEDETAVRMAANGVTAREIAKELTRPIQGTAHRLSKVLKDRIDAARSAPAPVSAPVPNSVFTPDQDTRLRGYMADGLGIGGAAAVLRMPRDQVAARWSELQQAGAA